MEFGQRQDTANRAVGVGFVVLMHAGLIYALVSGLARKAIEILPAPIETKILGEVSQEEELPPPPPPKLDVPPPVIPPPEVTIQQSAPRPNAITTAVSNATRAPVLNAKRNCREPEYPPVSERLGETGTVLLAMLVGVNGRVTESRVQQTSGFPRLDQAAQAALSRCQFTPGTAQGVPVAAWASIKYTFRKLH